MTLKEVYLFRIFQDLNQSLGSLSVYGDNEVNVFKTLELGWHENKNSVSCIPSGRYLCKWTLSPHLKKFTYEIMNVPSRAGIRIHSANYFYQLLGCVALGDAHKDINLDNHLDVIHSGNSVDKFNAMMDKQDFMLTVI